MLASGRVFQRHSSLAARYSFMLRSAHVKLTAGRWLTRAGSRSTVVVAKSSSHGEAQQEQQQSSMVEAYRLSTLHLARLLEDAHWYGDGLVGVGAAQEP
jgi:NAD(P)H-hydrate repair Nnr-like enzyme with NAD(P)H-hydrate epimerase domain